MDRRPVERLIASRRALVNAAVPSRRKGEGEGGCGVIGIACSEQIPGRHLLQALIQMRNRGNGKGGGIAAVGLDPSFFRVSCEVLEQDYLLAVALLDRTARPEVETAFIAPTFLMDHSFEIPTLPDFSRLAGLEVSPPDVVCYFVRVRPEARLRFVEENGLAGADEDTIDDEIVYQNSYRLNRAFYASTGEKRAFVLSHGKNLLVLKMVGFGDDVVRFYGLEDLQAHVWIGHHRYPTKGKVWHPGGAHPFIGMHEALVHNGDFANYASICSYLAQRNIYPLFLTDTEVAVLVFDLLHRIYGYPLEYVIEAMAPTTERDFALLPAWRRRIYQMLQAVHMHASPDGPWFFLLAQSDARSRACRLIGITDTSMLRPQVFALQSGEAAIGFAASEKQAIDAALESLAQEDARFWSHADLYWNARGGSHADGGAFLFTVHRNGAPVGQGVDPANAGAAVGQNPIPAGSEEAAARGLTCGSAAPVGQGFGPAGGVKAATLTCTDKFGRIIAPDPQKAPPAPGRRSARSSAGPLAERALSAEEIYAAVREALPNWGFGDLEAFLVGLERTASVDEGRRRAIEVLSHLLDRRVPTGSLKRSGVLALVDASLSRIFAGVRNASSREFSFVGCNRPVPAVADRDTALIIEARGFPAEGSDSLARTIVRLTGQGFRRFIVANARGHRFIGCGMGSGSEGVCIDVYGSSGDYLASGIDGADIIVHGSAQDQLGQIMKGGRLVVYGDVGQTFMYGAKGGTAFVLGNAAGRPLINAVGKPRVTINGTCLDYLAESFMAGDPLDGGGFVVLNGMAFDEDATLADLDTPYPGGNLFSLASGGALYVRDPYHRLGEEQLNGGAFGALTPADWARIRPHLEENERLFGIPLERLLQVDGRLEPPERVYRKIVPSGHKALAPEEAWVRKEA